MFQLDPHMDVHGNWQLGVNFGALNWGYTAFRCTMCTYMYKTCISTYNPYIHKMIIYIYVCIIIYIWLEIINNTVYHIYQYVYIYIFIYKCDYIYMYTYIYIYMYIIMYIDVWLYIYIHMYINATNTKINISSMFLAPALMPQAWRKYLQTAPVGQYMIDTFTVYIYTLSYCVYIYTVWLLHIYIHNYCIIIYNYIYKHVYVYIYTYICCEVMRP